MEIIRTIHRLLGEMLLVIALVGMTLAIAGLLRKRATERAEHIFGLVYAGLLDLQALLGVVSFIALFMIAGASLLTSRFILHPVLMILALVVVHASRGRREGLVPQRHWSQLVAYGVSFALVLAGRLILA